jgi:Bacterial RNA polymerase, alpha chain C terminal domain
MIILKCPNCECNLEINFGFRTVKEKDLSLSEVPPWHLTPLSDLELSTRTDNCLHNEGYELIGDVDNAKDAELLRITNFGQKSLREVRSLIRELKDKTPRPFLKSTSSGFICDRCGTDWPAGETQCRVCGAGGEMDKTNYRSP